jgi:two-component sensor histidine kinase/PAS domain-containing protein
MSPLLSQIWFYSLIFGLAIGISTTAGIYQWRNHRSTAIRWSAFLLIAIAIELSIYTIGIIGISPLTAEFSQLVQLLVYLLMDFFYLRFVVEWSGKSAWLNRTTTSILGVITILVAGVIFVDRWPATGLFRSDLGPFLNASDGRLLPGLAESVLFAYSYIVGLICIILMVRLSSTTHSLFRKYILAILFGDLLLLAAGILDFSGFNPFKPILAIYLMLAVNAIIILVLVFIWNIGYVIPTARQSAIDQMQDGFLVLDLQGKVIDFNLAASRMIGVDRALMIGSRLPHNWTQIIPVQSEQTEDVMQTLSNDITASYAVKVTPLISPANEPSGHVVVIHNITGLEDFEVEAQLRARKLARANAFISSLAEITSRLQTFTQPGQMMSILGKELRQFGLSCFIATLDENNELIVQYISIQAPMLQRVESLLNQRVQGYRLAPEKFPTLYEMLASRDVYFTMHGLYSNTEEILRSQFRGWDQIRARIGLGDDISTVIAPLIVADRIVGMLGVWGANLQDEDCAHFRVFASQLAWTIERAKLYEAEVQRSQALGHSTSLITALSRVASLLENTSDFDLVLETLGSELTKLGFNCAVVSLDSTGENAIIRYMSYSKALRQRLQILGGIDLTNYVIPKHLWPGEKVIREGVPVWYDNPDQIFERMFSRFPTPVTKLGIQLLGIDSNNKVCFLPLKVKDLVIGVMPIWGKGLNTDDAPAFSVFASQVAGILRNAESYTRELRRSAELARSNTTILALSKVAARLDTTSDFSQILMIVGNELKNLGLDSMIGSLSPDKQSMKIEYLSILEELTLRIGKTNIFWPAEVIVPRRLWPTDKAVTSKTPYWDENPILDAYKMFPFITRELFVQTMQLIGFDRHAKVCYLPMIVDEDVIGILAVWGPELKTNDIPALTVFANQVAVSIKSLRLYQKAQDEIAERILAEARIREALNDKEILLKEVHHRVKNNLQIIISLLNLQLARINDPTTMEALRESQNRVRSMALIHEKLYQSSDLAHIDFGEYVEGLVNSLIQTYRIRSSQVAVKVMADRTTLDLDAAIPCGLIINELVTNSLKYAFPDERPGTITVIFKRNAEDQFTLVVSDDGIGLPAGFDPKTANSLGLKVVSSLARQISGALEIDCAKGTRFELCFKTNTNSISDPN